MFIYIDPQVQMTYTAQIPGTDDAEPAASLAPNMEKMRRLVASVATAGSSIRIPLWFLHVTCGRQSRRIQRLNRIVFFRSSDMTH